MSNRVYGTSSLVESSRGSLEVAAPVVAAPMACGLMVGPGGSLAVSGAWAEIYRLAYEQARAALAPSWFQRMTQPSWN
ncbi:hypothetical protein [Aquisphaera insulae]|uniref:hypothetical protein n=1 Tax=Aquisphaera insulae TaxID=2712864 RepID=UPI0013EAA4EA|nr:hypothetical protein [Aquisphaera insulae]